MELLGHTVVLFFNILRNCHTVLYSGCTILHPHQQCIRVLIFPYPHQDLLLACFLIEAILMLYVHIGTCSGHLKRVCILLDGVFYECKLDPTG